MAFLIKIVGYLLGALALFLGFTSPAEKAEAPQKTFVAATSTESSRVVEKNASASSTEKIETKAEPPKKVAVSKPAAQVVQKPVPPVIPIPPPLPVPPIVISTTPILPPEPNFSFDDLNTKTRAALVNILCTTKRGGSFNPISGSGVVIDPRGVILTNAHVGQYLLLKDYLFPDFLECVIRTGEPARNRYKVKLLYISPEWVLANARKITGQDPTGTGENDFALLLVTDTTSPELPFPSDFPYLPMDFSNVDLRTKSEVLVAGYPAGLLGGISIQRDLYPSSAVVRVGTVYGFDDGKPDIFSIGGSVVAQQGSSGGGVVDKKGNLIGLIVTSTMGDTTSERDLNALTMSHLDDSFKKHTGDGLASLFAGDVRMSADSFNEKVAPTLKKVLTDVLAGAK